MNDISIFILESIMNSLEADANVISINLKIYKSGEIGFKVIDNGKGIEEKYIKNVFVKGFSLKPQCRGKGLYNINKYAEQTGGKAIFYIENNFTVLNVIFGKKVHIPLGDIERSIRPMAVTALGKIRYKFLMDLPEKTFSFDTGDISISSKTTVEVNEFLKSLFSEIRLYYK